jgi:hypothetical protein
LPALSNWRVQRAVFYSSGHFIISSVQNTFGRKKRRISDNWSIDWSIDRLIGWLIDWLINCLIAWLLDWSSEWLMCMIDWCVRLEILPNFYVKKIWLFFRIFWILNRQNIVVSQFQDVFSGLKDPTSARRAVWVNRSSTYKRPKNNESVRWLIWQNVVYKSERNV